MAGNRARPGRCPSYLAPTRLPCSPATVDTVKSVRVLLPLTIKVSLESCAQAGDPCAQNGQIALNRLPHDLQSASFSSASSSPCEMRWRMAYRANEGAPSAVRRGSAPLCSHDKLRNTSVLSLWRGGLASAWPDWHRHGCLPSLAGLKLACWRAGDRDAVAAFLTHQARGAPKCRCRRRRRIQPNPRRRVPAHTPCAWPRPPRVAATSPPACW